MIKPFWNPKKSNVTLYHGDCIDIMAEMPDASVDVVWADPPYFLSGKGTTCSGGKRVPVKKGKWDSPPATFAEMHAFNADWLRQCHRLLKPTGTIWVTGTLHSIHSIGVAMRQLGFGILNEVIWQKIAPPPNLGCRCLTHAHETLLWARKTPKSKHFFDYEMAKRFNGGKQLIDVWKIGRPGESETWFGKHPTQKPVRLVARCLAISLPKEGGVVLDPFQGHGTTGAAALGSDGLWQYIGIENDAAMLEVTKKRITALQRPYSKTSKPKLAPLKKKKAARGK